MKKTPNYGLLLLLALSGCLIAYSQTTNKVKHSESAVSPAKITFGWATAEVFPEKFIDKKVVIDGFIEINPSSPRYTLWIDESSLRYHRARRSVELNAIEMDKLFAKRSTDDRWWTSATGECVQIVGIFKHDQPESPDYAFGLGYITQIEDITALDGRRRYFSELLRPVKPQAPNAEVELDDPFNPKSTNK